MMVLEQKDKMTMMKGREKDKEMNMKAAWKASESLEKSVLMIEWKQKEIYLNAARKITNFVHNDTKTIQTMSVKSILMKSRSKLINQRTTNSPNQSVSPSKMNLM
jgi:uncharacterized protein with gpF-like domain